MSEIIQSKEYEQLLQTIGGTLAHGRTEITRAVNNTIVRTYWEIRRHIVDFEQKGNAKAEYGSDTLNHLSADLTRLFGSGFSRSNVFYIRKLYLECPKIQTVSELLSWSHYIELLKIVFCLHPQERGIIKHE